MPLGSAAEFIAGDQATKSKNDNMCPVSHDIFCC